MSTISVAVVLVGSVAVICLLLVSRHNKYKRKAMNNLLEHFSRLGIKNNLNFSGQEVLNNAVLGLDGINRKILVVTKEKGSYSSCTIALDEVKSFTVKKIYGAIKAGTWNDRELCRYLEKIILHFELNHKPSVEIIFYKNHNNRICEIQQLEQKAKHWKAMLTKMHAPGMA